MARRRHRLRQDERRFDPNVFLELRLAPDQFPFARQIQITCDTAKLAASRLTGKDAPSQPDTEKTIDELCARVRSTIAYLDGITAKDLEGAATRLGHAAPLGRKDDVGRTTTSSSTPSPTSFFT